ncbi:MAG: DUF4870 domain-containing protein [Ornithinimicrobium sp.]
MSTNPPPPPPPDPADPAPTSEPQQPDPNPRPPTQEWQSGTAQYAAPAAGSGTRLSESEEKTWSILAHLSAPVAALVSVGMLNFVGPLIIWAIYKDRSQRVRHAAAGAFNFNLSLWILYAVLVVASILSLGLLLIVTIPIGIVVWIASMVLHIMAAIKASNGEVYTYPAQLPVLK